MTPNVYSRSVAVAFVFVFAAGFFSPQLLAQTTTVEINSLGDSAKSPTAATGQCATGSLIDGVPECTLRAAIQAANERIGQINIQFSNIPISVGTLSSITIGSALPAITSRVEIRGQTHPNWSAGFTNVLISGSASGIIQSYNALTFSTGSDNSRVESIGISLVNDAITVNGADNITITNSIIGGARQAMSFLVAPNGRDGIRLVGANQTVISNSLIRANGRHGILITSGSSSNVIFGNHFGVRPSGSTFAPFEDSANGGVGIVVTAFAGSGNQLGSFGGNYLANNLGGAIQISANGQIVTRNRIGVPPAEGVANNFSAEDYANGGVAAIAVWSSDNQIGTGTSTGNVIGNGDQAGVLLGLGSPSNVPASNNLVAGNRIGLDQNNQPFGLTEGIDVLRGSDNIIRNNIIANNDKGIHTRSTSSGTAIHSNQILDNTNEGILIVGGAVVGGETMSTANVIGGSVRGVIVNASNGTATIRNNYVGTNADADDLGNSIGIQIQNNGGVVEIGQPGRGNVIGHNSGIGVFLASGARFAAIRSNFIGVHPDGTPIGNTTGIRVSGNQDALENWIGYAVNDVIEPLSFFYSPVAGERGNLIAHNSSRGVWVSGGDDAIRNSIRGNRLFGNADRDIDLGMSEIDPDGSATGPNTQLNWPEFSALTNFNLATGEASVVTRVRTNSSNASYPLRVDLYWVDPFDPSQMTFIEGFEYPATSAGLSFTHTFTWPAGLPFSGHLVATASDNASGPFANTSQFSPTYTFTQGPGTLATTTSNNGVGGVYLDLEAISQTLYVTGFDLGFSGNAGTSVDVAVYVRDGSYEGEETNASAWTLHETVPYQRAGTSGFATADLLEPIQVEPGQTRAIYLQALGSQGIRYSGTGDFPAQTAWSNADLSLYSGVATTALAPFTGPLFEERSFAGIVRYEIQLVDELFGDRFEQ